VLSLLPDQHLNALQTVAYAELFDYLHGKLKLPEAISLIKQNTRHYAKRQITWANRNENLIWLEGDLLNSILAYF
jgi:tRNA dimethylallyltransferase